MTDLARLYFQFWSQIPKGDGSFLPAFLEESVPASTPFPYLTYSLSRNDMFVSGLDQVRVWTRSTSVSQLMGLLESIEEAIPHGGTILDLPNGKGAIALNRGTPFIQRQPMPADEADIQVGFINVEVQSYIY